MKNYQMAWRNLWRNRRRTMITATSVFFAVFFALFMRSIQIGSYDYMYKNVIESYSGYIQVQQSDWWDEKTLDNSFDFSAELQQQLLNREHVEELIPRVESFALASSGANTKGVMVMGIDPEKESLLSNVTSKLIKYQLSEEVLDLMKRDDRFTEENIKNSQLFKGAGYSNWDRLLMDLDLNIEESEKYLPFFESNASISHVKIMPGEEGVWLGEKLASYLELMPGDTLVLMGQGYHGTTAAGKYEIKGLLKLPIPEISATIVYLPYDIAQDLYGMGENLTSIVLSLNDNDDKTIESCLAGISENLPEGISAKGWREMNEVTIQQMEADNVGGMFMIAILYLVIGFGILGTVLMMTSERKREFGVLVAVGMQKKKLKAVMSWEMLYMGLLGIGLGMAICIPIILWGVEHPIIFKGELAHIMEEYDFEPKLAFEPIGSYFLWQMFVVGLMIMISLVHPIRKISKMKVVNALRA